MTKREKDLRELAGIMSDNPKATETLMAIASAMAAGYELGKKSKDKGE